MNGGVRLFVGLLIFVFSVELPAQEKMQSPVRTAFDNATRTLVTYRRTGVLGDTEIQWAKNLKVLAQSNSRQADQLLAQLGLFAVDGAFAEEFSCAASKRGKNLSIQLRRQLKTFNMSNACEQMAVKEGIPLEKLCKTKEAFKELVSTYRDLPRSDTEGACGY